MTLRGVRNLLYQVTITRSTRRSPCFDRASSTMSTLQAEPNAKSGLSPLSKSTSSFRSRALAVTAAHRMTARTDPLISLSSDSTNGLRVPRASSESDGSTSALNAHNERYHWLSRGATLINRTGDEPGIDVKSRRDEEGYRHLTEKSKITVVDYCSDPDGRNTRVEFDGDQLVEWLDSEHGARLKNDDGKPHGVRWMHVNGLNWEVIKTLTTRFGLHPLAVEDTLQAENSHRSKIDFYKSHLYLQVLIQHINPSDETVLAEAADEMTQGKMSERLDVLDTHSMWAERQATGSHHHTRSPHSIRGQVRSWSHRRDQDGDEEDGNGRTGPARLPPGVQGVFEPALALPPKKQGQSTYSREAYRMTIAQLTAKYMIPVRRAMLCAFMTRDGSLITIMSHTVADALDPIYERLEDSQSMLRKSQDVSMLAQALLDVSVDLALEVSSAFEAEILNLEASVLVDPSIQTVRHLHVLSSQLIRLRQSLFPVLRLTSTIRDHDSQRSAAAAAVLSGRATGPDGLGATTPGTGKDIFALGSSRATTPGHEKSNPLSSALGSSSNGISGLPIASSDANLGFFSPMARVYMVDVIDHLENAISSLDQFIGTCEHLTDYVFNVLSFQTNGSMERLSIVTVVFLPLTFIASYFGMNFDDFTQLRGPVSYFWKVAIPASVGFFLVFSYSYIKWGIATFSRRVGRWRRGRMLAKRNPMNKAAWMKGKR